MSCLPDQRRWGFSCITLLCQKVDPILVAILFFDARIPDFECSQYNPCSLLDDFKTFVSDMCHLAGNRHVWISEVSFADDARGNPKLG